MDNDFFQRLIEKEVTSCISVAVMKQGELVYRYTNGFSCKDLKTRSAVHEKTQFNVGSVTKVIMGALIVKLVERGEISLNDLVQKHVPQYINDQVTVLHLLNHTAGYRDFPWISWPKVMDKAEYMQQVYGMSSFRTLHPGIESNYFTFGYSILMDLVERVTGLSLEQFAKQILFEPLEMRDTTFDTTTLQRERYVLACTMDNEAEDVNLQGLAVTGDSGLYSTAEDLLRFISVFRSKGMSNGKKIFSPCGVELMLRESTNGQFSKTPVFWLKSNVDTYGCFGDLHSPATFGHPGFSGCMLWMDPQHDIAAAIVTNSQKMHADWTNYRRINNYIMSNLID